MIYLTMMRSGAASSSRNSRGWARIHCMNVYLEKVQLHHRILCSSLTVMNPSHGRGKHLSHTILRKTTPQRAALRHFQSEEWRWMALKRENQRSLHFLTCIGLNVKSPTPPLPVVGSVILVPVVALLAIFVIKNRSECQCCSLPFFCLVLCRSVLSVLGPTTRSKNQGIYIYDASKSYS